MTGLLFHQTAIGWSTLTRVVPSNFRHQIVMDHHSMLLEVDGTLPTSFQLQCMSNAIPRFAVERTSTHFKVWFWSRYDPTVPHDVARRRRFVNPSHWVKNMLPLIFSREIYLWYRAFRLRTFLIQIVTSRHTSKNTLSWSTWLYVCDPLRNYLGIVKLMFLSHGRRRLGRQRISSVLSLDMCW